ncbi:Putative Function: eryBIV of S. erythrae is involved in erythromycin biosynthesis [Penicillium brasilianum]|uniref:Putative Function: eryBIV of S. erythrae is involved in erythromycin biosynthesis n=1 Tax=Penicillium brasilianum TaxID=104259 RepID=A0A0F7THY2_PENBI|nr:Putative Function: eryBIV of S. erythrae is involved in erythromycin biosynthesis [Penicillium brasilianum]
MAAKRLVVAGGSGFLGSRICRAAAARGWEVTSLSRSGEPHWDTVTSSKERPSWASSVEWAKADILKPETYKPFLTGASAVVHTMGILLEADYKGVVQGREPLVGGLQRAFSSSKLGSQNPLQRKEGEALEPKEKDGQLTYELMNRDSAIALAQESSNEHVPTFVYISAAAGAPVLPARYITTKREAEATIASSLPELRSIFIRPGFMYDSSRKFTLPIALGGFVASEFNNLLGNKLGFLGAMAEKPLKVDVVGEAVVEALEDESTRGAVGTKQIEQLATKAWRKTML